MRAELERQYVRTTAMIAASEDWAEQYNKDHKTFAQLIKAEARFQLGINKFLADMAANAEQLINVGAYYQQVTAAYDVEVIVEDIPLEKSNNTFISLFLEDVTEMVAIGVKAGEVIYDIPLGISSTSASVQKLGLDHVASLVGKKVLKDGSIVDNPKAAINITQTMRNDIAQSIKKSLALGETIQDATDRIRTVIADPKRAEMIARTESVNAYQSGLTLFGEESGAVGKVWLTVGAIDICSTFAAEGPVAIDYLWGGKFNQPTAHPHCRCGRRLIYPQEWAQLNK